MRAAPRRVSVAVHALPLPAVCLTLLFAGEARALFEVDGSTHGIRRFDETGTPARDSEGNG
jgi:hypothetical protein